MCCGPERRLQHAYCAVKPLVGLAIVAAAEAEDLSLEAPLVEQCESGWLRRCHPTLTLRQLLSHEAGLGNPDAATVLLSEARAAELLLGDARSSPRAEYSDVAGAWVAQEVLGLRGVSLTEALGMLTRSDAGMEDVCFTLEGWRRLEQSGASLIAPRATLADGRRLPMLSECQPRRLMRLSPVFDGLVSAKSLLSFYRNLGRLISGDCLVGWPSPTSVLDLMESSESRYDSRLQRDARFAAMMMMDIPLPSGELAMGHAGGFSSSVGFHEIRSGLSGVILDLEMGSPSIVEKRRRHLMGRLFSAISKFVG